jgi:RND family efflux transporter MFP subunit
MKPLGIAGVLALGLAAGSAVTYVALGRTSGTSGATSAGRAAPSSPSAAAPAGVAAVTLGADVIQRAGIRTAPASTIRAAADVSVPAVIEANAYKQVAVTAVAAGRVTRADATLGEHVTRGALLVQLYSPELADAQRTYVSAVAELRAHERQLARTERLTQIGAASQQELEQAHAEHAMMTSAVDGAESKLELLGVSEAQVKTLAEGGGVSATVDVRAPIDGVVTARDVNAGLNVAAGAPLLTIVDLSNVWVVGSVLEQDATRIREGARAAVTIGDRPPLPATIAYVDPQVNAETRAMRIRVELPNPQGSLRPGMYANIRVTTESAEQVPAVPASAIQTVGTGAVVYVEDAPGHFVERPVRAGTPAGDLVPILSGVSAGERVVTDGSFYVRAERERLSPASSAAPPAGTLPAEPRQTARIAVTAKGFEPDRVTLPAGIPARLTIVRTTDQTCATDIVFPSLNLKRALPLNQPIDVDLTPVKGELTFTCGMQMFKGSVVGR